MKAYELPYMKKRHVSNSISIFSFIPIINTLTIIYEYAQSKQANNT